MPNEFITIKNIARQTLPRLIENLVFPNLIYKDYSEAFAYQGDTIQVRKPVMLEASEFVQESGTTPQDVKETSVDVTLNHLATVDIEFTAIQRATNVDDLNRLFLEPAAVALAQKINADGLDLYKDIPYVGGTAGTTPSELTDISNVRKLLNINKAPTTLRRAVWDPEADASFVTIPAIVNAEKSGSTAALREGSIGRIMGIDNYMSQAVKSHVTGATGTPAVDLSGGYQVGATTIHVDGLTTAFIPGDLFTLGDYTYTVVAAGALSTADQDITIYPGLKAAAANDAAITVIGNHTANLGFHENAFAFVTRPLVAPAGVESYVTSYNGVTMRVVRGYDMKYKKEMLSMDVLYGYKTMYPELAVRYLG